MKIGINASFLRKPDTGMGQITANFVKFLVNLGKFAVLGSEFKIKDVDFFLYLEEDVDLDLPKNFHKRIFLPKFQQRDDLVRKIIWEKFLLPKKVRADGCDLLVSPYQSATVLHGIRHNMLVHDMIWKVFPEYLDNWRKKLYAALCFGAIKRADQIITISHWSQRDIQKYLKIPPEKIKIAYPSVDEIFFSGSERNMDNAILEKYDIFGQYIFYVGGLDFRKNIPTLLAAFKLMQKKYDLGSAKLVIAGEDKSKFSPLFCDLKKEIENLELEDKVNLIGFVEQEDLPAIYRQCELFVFPSLYEGFGLPILEAMACGAPIAASKSSSIPEIGGDAILYFDPYDEEEIAKVMHKILSSSKVKTHLSEKGRERARKFKWETFVREILK